MLVMRFECLAPQDLPHASRLYTAYLTDFRRASAFYAHPPSLEGARAAAAEASVGTPTDLRGAVVDALRAQNAAFGGDASVEGSLSRLKAGAVAVVAGQQVGLFTGPAYSLYKALTAIRVASELTARGTEAVPVFWLASEDHDLAEVNHCDWPGREGLERLELSHDSEREGQRAGEVALGGGIEAVLGAALAALDGPGADAISSALRAAYTAQETFASSFAKLVSRLLSGRGLILLDPLNPHFAALAAPVLSRALRENEAIIAALLQRGRELEKAGFHAQVKVTERGTLLFAMLAGRRVPLRTANGAFRAGEQSFSLGDLEALLARDPNALSSSALLRPIVQDTLLPTAAIITGPGELAYYAQSSVVYRRLLGRMPAILPRAGFTLIEPHVARLMRKYRLGVRDVLRGRQYLRRRLERESVPRSLARQMTTGERNIKRYLLRMRNPLVKLDPTLAGALETAQKKMLYQLEKLRARAGRASDRREELLDRHERILREAIAPHRGLQERSVCPLPIFARHGLEVLDSLQERALGDSSAGGSFCHHVVFL
jgi:bacillithiol biosynthesis cysteine-adding enzyme BshC